jgi:hypothetical protein
MRPGTANGRPPKGQVEALQVRFPLVMLDLESSVNPSNRLQQNRSEDPVLLSLVTLSLIVHHLTTQLPKPTPTVPGDSEGFPWSALPV